MEDSYPQSAKTELWEENRIPAAEETRICSSGCSRPEKLNEIPAACGSVFYQTDLVSVPVKVMPFAKAGPCTTVCCGSPVITPGDSCIGEVGQTCEFTITQKICVKLPLHFGASISIDRSRIQCGGISETEYDCTNPGPRACN